MKNLSKSDYLKRQRQKQELLKLNPDFKKDLKQFRQKYPCLKKKNGIMSLSDEQFNQCIKDAKALKDKWKYDFLIGNEPVYRGTEIKVDKNGMVNIRPAKGAPFQDLIKDRWFINPIKEHYDKSDKLKPNFERDMFFYLEKQKGKTISQITDDFINKLNEKFPKDPHKCEVDESMIRMAIRRFEKAIIDINK